jgi:peptidyl-prolyl cis-trans isomerase B (cyclophilin B)
LYKIFLILSVSLLLVSFGNYSFAQTDDKLAVLETNLGTIIIEFFSNDAPKHVDNFIGLTESGFYDGVLFHRIIPGFMIQGGDPNTIDGDSSTWGTGGPSTSVDAEFNTIKHNRGIVSMARSADPNSGGSQFFIVHADSNFLDEQYTVFGRIVTEESFETLDKIASVETASQDRPQDPEQVKITKITIVNRSEVSNILKLQEPERTESTITPSTGNQKFENTEHEIAFSAPEGWMLQYPEKTDEDSPDIVAVGPKVGLVNPVFSLTIKETNQKTMKDIISEKTITLQEILESGNLRIISQKETTLNGNDAYVLEAEGEFSSDDQEYIVKFKEVMIYDTEKFYILAYSNGVEEFESHLPLFEETINSFEILSQKTSNDETSTEEGGGCLIATATFGSELAPQVQQLREIRDNIILSTESGTAFMSGFNQFYYSFSPIIADLERENPLFKEAVKLSITPMLSTFSILNYVDIDSETEMLSYGIGIILMNVGIYFVAPTIIIYKIRK